jgi:hypothetical protein
MILPSAAARADYFLAFDSSGDVTVGSGSGGGSVTESQVQAFMYPITADEITHGYVVGDLNRNYPTGHIDRYIDNPVPGTTDVAAPLQIFFDFITQYDVGTAVVSGTFGISTGLIFGNPGSYTGTATLHFNGSIDLRALNAIDTMLTFQNTYYSIWNGNISVFGTGDDQYVNRTCRVGIQFGVSAALSGERMTVNRIYARSFQEWGIVSKIKSTALRIGETRLVDCGSGQPGAGYSLTGNYSNSVRNGAVGSVNQTNTIDVDVQPPTTFIGEARFIVIAGEVYNILSQDSGAGTITIFPWLNVGDVSGTFYYMFGGGLITYGNDASVTQCDTVDALRCGAALSDQALYGMEVSRLIAQSCGSGYVFGREGSAAQLGGNCGVGYFENNTFDLVCNTRDRTGKFINSEIAMNLSKIVYPAYPRTTADLQETFYPGILNFQGYLMRQVTLPNNRLDTDATPSEPMFTPDGQARVLNRDVATVTLRSANSNFNDHFGTEARYYCVLGSNADGSPSGTITFVTDGGWTVNGGASVSFTGFYGPALFACKAKMASTDILIHPVNLLPDFSIEQGTIVSLDANLNDKTDPINLVDKVVGKRVYNQTNGRPVYAAATADIGVWHFSDGTTSNTPV